MRSREPQCSSNTKEYTNVPSYVGFISVVLFIDVNVQDRYEATALHLAAKNGHTAILQELLTVPETDINRRDRGGATAL